MQAEQQAVEMWAGVECTLNRVGDVQHDQLALTGHYDRPGDIALLAELGIRAVRYPILWERMGKEADDSSAWHALDERMRLLLASGIEPIVGLVHHGSGPMTTHLLDDEFATGLAAFALRVATRYPWVTRYTPVNEPLTTARFSALYGHWYPHERDEALFFRATLNQVRAIRLAMAAIRTINPDAQLLQTEDLARTHSTPALQYQADFENERRWLPFDLLTGRVKRGHRLHTRALNVGITPAEIDRAVGDGCTPNELGLNHYVTSERWIDERIELYPAHTHGGNGNHVYADVEAVRAMQSGGAGPRALLLEAWARYQIPIVVSEVHLGCTREQQLRWLHELWTSAQSARDAGAEIRAVVAWAALGTYDWSSLVTKLEGKYEPGLFDIRAPRPRRTALASMVKSIALTGNCEHPVLDSPGWWRSPERLVYGSSGANPAATGRPVLIVGAEGPLGITVHEICQERGLASVAAFDDDLDIDDHHAVIRRLASTGAWAVVNAGRVDGGTLAAACAEHGVPLVAFSSNAVFDGSRRRPYVESDRVSPAGADGTAQVRAELDALALLPHALIIRTCSLFGGAGDDCEVTRALRSVADGIPVRVNDDQVTSATYIPDVVNTMLDLLIDGETGIWHLTNHGALTTADLTRMAARCAGIDASLVQGEGSPAARAHSLLGSERTSQMPSIEDAIARFTQTQLSNINSRMATEQCSV